MIRFKYLPQIIRLLSVAAVTLIVSGSSEAIPEEPQKAAPKAEWKSISLGGKEYSYAIAGEKASQEALALFNKRLNKVYPFLGNVSACHFIIRLHGGRNTNYGGICTMEISGEDNSVFLCTSQITNALSAQFAQMVALSEKRLAEFVVRNCFGG